MSKKSTEIGVGKKVLASALSAAMVVAFAPAVAMADGSESGDTQATASQPSNDGQTAGAVVTTAEALKTAVEAGGEVILGADIALTGAVVIPQGKTVALDLAGYVLSGTKTVILNNGTLTVKASGAGKITSSGNCGIAVGNNSVTTIESGTVEVQESAVITGQSTGASITINGGTFTSKDNAVIAGNGSNRDGEANTITVNGGTFNGGIQTEGYVACGIYAPWKDAINVSGGIFNITGGAGIVARAGQVTVSNGKFNVTGNVTGKVGDSRVVVPCSAVVFDEEAAYPALADDSSVKVTGGEFVSEAAAISTVPSADSAIKRVQVSGGTFADIANAVKYAANTATLTMGAGATASLTIPAGKDITLDLNGKKLTNVAGQHTITNDGTLTITDSASGGIVDDISHAKAALYNNGTCTLVSGSFVRSEEKGTYSPNQGNGNSWYTIYNKGAMTIGDSVDSDKVSVENSGGFSSMIRNDKQLIINGGTFTGGINTVKSDEGSTTVINGGTFSNTAQYVIQNWSTTTINGGTFQTAPTAKQVLFTSSWEGKGGTLNVNGGVFKAATESQGIVRDYYDDSNKGKASVSGGTFSANPVSYVDINAQKVYKMLDGTYVVSATEPAHTGNGNAYSGPVDGVYTEYVYSAPVTPVDPTPTPTPTPEPAAPGTNVSGTDSAGNTVEATVTDNNKTTLPDGTEAAGSVEYKGTASSGSEPASNAEIPSSVTSSDGTVYAVTKIADDAFNGQGQLKSVSIPATVVEIGARAFAGTGIESVKLPAATSTLGAGAFKGCASLKTADISSAALTQIPEDAFNGAAITSIDIPGTVKSVGARAFKGTALKSVELPKAVTSIAKSTFQDCDALKSASSSAKTIGRSAFAGCGSLKTVSLPKATEVGAYALSGTALKSVSLPKAESIGAGAFKDAAKLKALATGSVLEELGPKALDGTKIKTLTIKSKRLTKSGVKGSLKGSAVTRVEVAVTGSKKTQDKYVKRYSKFFAKANSGKSVEVTKAKKASKK